MGIAYLAIFTIYILISIVVVVAAKKIFKRRWLTWIAVAFVLLFPTYDIIIQISLLKYYELTRQPLQQITRTVENPGSVYWEDNVWPGYDENYRLWMIDHLLDGEHLDTLAMNGPDGKIYLYRYGKGDTPEVFSDLTSSPQLNYHIKLDPVELWFWQKPFVWGDRIEIIDNTSNELIAYSERYMGYSPNVVLIKSIGGFPFEGGAFAGIVNVYDFDNVILFKNMREMFLVKRRVKIAPESSRSRFGRDDTNRAVNNYINNYRGKFTFKLEG